MDVWGNLKRGHMEGFKASDLPTIGDYINMQANIKQAVNVYGISDSQAPDDLRAVSILKQSEKSWADIEEVNYLIGEVTNE